MFLQACIETLRHLPMDSEVGGIEARLTFGILAQCLQQHCLTYTWCKLCALSNRCKVSSHNALQCYGKAPKPLHSRLVFTIYLSTGLDSILSLSHLTNGCSVRGCAYLDIQSTGRRKPFESSTLRSIDYRSTILGSENLGGSGGVCVDILAEGCLAETLRAQGVEKLTCIYGIWQFCADTGNDLLHRITAKIGTPGMGYWYISTLCLLDLRGNHTSRWILQRYCQCFSLKSSS